MRITNRASRTLTWQAYRADDGVCSIPLPDKQGTIGPDKDVSPGMGQHSVKLRIGRSYDAGPVFGPFINTGAVVINPSERPVPMDDYRTRYVNLAAGTATHQAAMRLAAASDHSRVVLAATRAIVGALPAQLAPVKALANLLIQVLVDEQRPPDAPQIDEIKAALEEVVTDEAARQQSAAIMAAWAWLDGEARLVEALKAKGLEPSAEDMARFDLQVDAALGPNSDFLIAMQRLLTDDQARKRAFVTFRVGTALYLRLQLLAIERRRLYRKLVPQDYVQLQAFLSDAMAALDKTRIALSNDYTAALKKADLGPSPEGRQFAMGFNIATVGVANDGDDPAPVVRAQVEDLRFILDGVDAAAAQAGGQPEFV